MMFPVVSERHSRPVQGQLIEISDSRVPTSLLYLVQHYKLRRHFGVKPNKTPFYICLFITNGMEDWLRVAQKLWIKAGTYC